MYAVILAGGGGTRLWPLSRRARPKPFLPLTGEKSLFQLTMERVEPLVGREGIYVVAEDAQRGTVHEQAPQLRDEQVLGEPFGRNTAAAVALAALAIERRADEVMAVLPADHIVTDEDGFRHALSAAAGAAADGSFVTLGVAPSGLETGYGYIVGDDAGETQTAVRRVARFVEKPDKERALELLRRSAGAWWNAGIFIWRRGALLAGLERHAPDILAPLRDGLAAKSELADVYAGLRATSIDYALLEPASLEGQVKVVPIDVGWSDLGSWTALHAELAGRQTEDGRVVSIGRSENVGSEDVLVHSTSGRLVVTVGLRGTIIVDTPDVLLVCDAERAQDVRRIVDQLAAAKETEHL